jgi:hypothetical protein
LGLPFVRGSSSWPFFLAIQNMVKNGVLIVMIILVVFDPTFGRKT